MSDPLPPDFVVDYRPTGELTSSPRPAQLLLKIPWTPAPLHYEILVAPIRYRCRKLHCMLQSQFRRPLSCNFRRLRLCYVAVLSSHFHFNEKPSRHYGTHMCGKAADGQHCDLTATASHAATPFQLYSTSVNSLVFPTTVLYDERLLKFYNIS